MAAVADLISRANVFAMQNPMLAQMLSGVGLTQQQLNDYLQRVAAVSQSITTNGLLVLGENEELFTHTCSFSGLSEVMRMQIMCLCGASGYPVSRLFGETQSGLSSSNEGDLQAYYDNADQERQHKDRPLMDRLIPIICMSVWGEIPDDLDYNFAPIRTMSAKEKAELAKSQSDAIVNYFNAGILGRQTTLREIQTASKETNLGTNVTDEMIEAADDDVQVPLQIEAEEARAGTEEFTEGKTGVQSTKTQGAKDSWFERAWARLKG
jgi:phage-related protein (TIGR01555 family)